MPFTTGASVRLALAAAIVLLGGCGGPQARFATHMQRGQQYFAKSDFAKAGVEFRNALQIQPNNGAARLAAGEVAEKLEKYPQAVSFYQAAIDVDPDNVKARVNLSRLLMFGGLTDRALQVIEAGLAKHPDQPDLLAFRASARAQRNDESGAIADAEHALRVARDNEEAIAVRAALYRRKGDFSSAKSLVEGAVASTPDSAPLREMLADLCEVSGDLPGAEQQLKELVRLKPQELAHRDRLAVFYAHADRLDDAQTTLEAAVSALPGNANAKLHLVQFLTSRRGKAQGEEAMRRLISQSPQDYELQIGLADLLLGSGDTAGASSQYRSVVEHDGAGPPGLVARNRLAAIAFTAGKYDEARALTDEVLAKSPADDDALLTAGRLALVKGDATAAIGDFRAVLHDQPQLVQVHRLLAGAYLANHELTLAAETLRAAVDAAPKDAATRLELGQVLIQTGHADTAVTELEKGVQAAPEDPNLRAGLVRAYLFKRDFAAAERAAGDLQTLRPKSAAGPYLKGLAEEGLTQPEAARKEYERALALEPDNFDALGALAQLLQHTGAGSKAVTLLKGAVERKPDDPAVLNLLGEFYLANANLAQADATLTRATTVAPKWWIPWRNLALVKVARKDSAGAIAAYQGAVLAAPGEPQPAAELALVYRHQGRTDDAIGVYEALHRANPGALAATNNLAMLLATYRQDRPSLDRARDLTANLATSKSGSFLDTTGWVHFKRAEYDEALHALQRASELELNSREIRGHLGLAELHAGQADRARRDLESGLGSGTEAYEGADEVRTALASLKRGSG